MNNKGAILLYRTLGRANAGPFFVAAFLFWCKRSSIFVTELWQGEAGTLIRLSPILLIV